MVAEKKINSAYYTRSACAGQTVWRQKYEFTTSAFKRYGAGGGVEEKNIGIDIAKRDRVMRRHGTLCRSFSV